MSTVSTEDLRSLAWTDVAAPLPKEQLYAALQASPFLYVPGTFNTRDLGLIPGTPKIRPGYAFRSGALNGLSDDGKKVLTGKLGIRRIFDLRSQREHATQPDPEVPGAEVVWTPSEEVDAVVGLEEFVDGEGEKGYATMYMDVLKVYKDSIKTVLEHVRDHPTEPFLFHCTAGRDRTGVVAGILMALAGGEPDAITFDFMLSRIGTEPVRDLLLAFALKGSGAESVEAPGFHNLCNLKTSGWDAFVKAAESEYGGFEGYVTKTLGFSSKDLATIKKNLVAATN
ncbi:protein-tyrosine phosphatase-like protein [Apodospora peruviana]|uniref:Protein-tyrosine phosphatase-like protein n=1 Tax=Apodospora peruviana TaxID=516989 RepID=A0AAE0IIA9_9PEZI|nr:protein-tyrosine phosphatase-like protein [Apodospora peruviana]